MKRALLSLVLVTALSFNPLTNTIGQAEINEISTESLEKTQTSDYDTIFKEVNGDLVPEFTLPEIDTPIFNTEPPDTFTVVATNQSGTRSPLTYEVWTKTSSKTVLKNTFITWHPDCPTYRYNVIQYGFGTIAPSLSVSVGVYKNVSLSYAPQGNFSSFFIKSDPTKWTRPAIYGDVVQKTYSVKTYNTAGILIGSKTATQNFSSNTYYKALNK